MALPLRGEGGSALDRGASCPSGASELQHGQDRQPVLRLLMPRASTLTRQRLEQGHHILGFLGCGGDSSVCPDTPIRKENTKGFSFS